MFYAFNTNVLDREYAMGDLRKMLPITDPKYGLREDFYGGRITHIGETDSDVLLLIDNRQPPKSQMVDLGAVQLNNIPMRFIKELCKKRKIPFGRTSRKEELIAKLEGGCRNERNTQNVRWQDDEGFRNGDDGHQ